MKSKTIFGLFLGLLAFAYAPAAFAQAFDICGSVRFYDTRTDRFTGSPVNNGNLNTNMPAKRVKLYLWDRNGSCQDTQPGCVEADDYVLRTLYTNASNGTFCFDDVHQSFDVYYTSQFESDDTQVQFDADPIAPQRLVVASSVVQDYGVPDASRAENPDGGDMTKDFNLVCNTEIDGLCTNAEATAATPANQRFANALAAGVDLDVLVKDYLYHLNGFNNPITILERSTPPQVCTSTQTGPYNPPSPDFVCIPSVWMDDNHAVVHELGHALHKRSLNIGNGTVSGCTGDWPGNVGTAVGQRCATAEGFADFVSLATHFPAASTAAVYQAVGNNAEGATMIGNNQLEFCASANSFPERTEANVARYFWDLYDTATVGDNWFLGAADVTTRSFEWIMLQWDEFKSLSNGSSACNPPPGGSADPDCCATYNCTANRESYEGGSSSVNGRNVWDFRSYAFPYAYYEVYVNCLNWQEL